MAYQIETCPIRAALTLENIWQLLLYMCFLGLLTFNITGNPQSYPLFKTKAMIENVMSRGQYPLSAVNSIPDIYDFLEHTFVPAVAAQNVTLLDARCTADGRHANSLCLDDPFTNEALCCYTKQPNRGILAPGSHTKNLLVSPPVLRQQRVMATLAQDSPLRYFALEAIGSKGSRQKNKIASGGRGNPVPLSAYALHRPLLTLGAHTLIPQRRHPYLAPTYRQERRDARWRRHNS